MCRVSMCRIYCVFSCLFAILSPGASSVEAEEDTHPIYSHQMQNLAGEQVDLADYRGKVLLIVNTASECGATPQYEPLQKLHETYAGQGLAVLAFPCNQFGGQEPGTSAEIADFCRSNYGVTFPVFSKIDVKGKQAAPLFAYLASDKTDVSETGDIRWNFEKFLVSRDGRLLKRFRTPVEPDSPEVIQAIEAALKSQKGRLGSEN
jgi:glutathione peroxidase